MSRSQFGGTDDDVTFAEYQFGNRKLVSLVTNKALTFWSAEGGGTQYTDLLLDAVAVTSITTDEQGQVPLFQGPDAITNMWADGGDGRFLMVTTDAAALANLRDEAETARDEAVEAAEDAAAIGAIADAAVAGFVNNGASATRVAMDAVFAAGDFAALETLVDALDTQVTQLMDTTATVEELAGSAYVAGRWSSGTMVQTLGVAAGQNIQTIYTAPVACEAVAFTAVLELASVTAHNTDYLTCELRRTSSAGVVTVIASKTTRISDGEAITQRIPWSFAGASWDSAAATLAVDDMLSVKWLAFGTAVLTFPVHYTWRIVPS